MNTYVWQVRREFWQNRAIWIVPVVIGALLTLAALFGRVDIDTLAPADHDKSIGAMVLFSFGAAFFVVMNVYATWYLLDCLHSDRQDRSVLFWKSLPISDTSTVLAKLFTGLIAIPLVYFLAADLSTLLVVFVVSVRTRGPIVSALWQPDVWLQLQAMWLYVIATTAIWYLPFAGWLMLMSAWAKRAVMLWALLLPALLYVLERKFLGTNVFGTLILDRTLGYVPHAFHHLADHARWAPMMDGTDLPSTPISVWRLLDPVGLMSSPATWIGATVGCALLVAAVQLRQRRTEM